MPIYQHFEVPSSPTGTWRSYLGTDYVANANRVTITNTDGSLTLLYGSFTVSNGTVTAGLIDQMSHTDAAVTVTYEMITGLAIDAMAFLAAPSMDARWALVFANPDSLIGYSGDETLDGGGGNDIMYGHAGADTMNGGDGIDTVSYAGSSSGAQVNLASMFFGGSAAGDWITGVEYLTGTAYDDVLVGHNDDNVFNGGQGHDILNGWEGNDLLIGGAGGDDLHGYAGNDTASYVGSNAAVIVNLMTGEGFGGHAEGDTLIGIDNLIGSSFDDGFVGDEWGNAFDGADGADTLKGAGGSDVLTGGRGNDALFGGGDDDTAMFSGHYADYQFTQLDNGNVEVVDLRPGSPDGTDTLSSVERLQFTDYYAFTSLLIDPNIAALPDVLWQRVEGANSYLTAGGYIFSLFTVDVELAPPGDFIFHDGHADVVAHGSNTNVYVSDGAGGGIVGHVATTWHLRGAGDFDGDGDDEILWRHQDGDVVTWDLYGFS